MANRQSKVETKRLETQATSSSDSEVAQTGLRAAPRESHLQSSDDLPQPKLTSKAQTKSSVITYSRKTPKGTRKPPARALKKKKVARPPSSPELAEPSSSALEYSSSLYQTGTVAKASGSSDHDTDDSDLAFDLDEMQEEISGLLDDKQRPVLALPIGQQAVAEARDFATDGPRHLYGRMLDNIAWIGLSAYQEDFVDRYAVAVEFGESRYRWAALKVMSSMDQRVLQTIIEGNLPEANRLLKDPHITEIYSNSAWMEYAELKKAPSIYCIYIADGRGRSPSAFQYCQVIKHLRAYISGLDENTPLALDIDNMNDPKRPRSTKECIEKGGHWFLKGREARVKKIVTFCKALELRFNGMTYNEMKEPLKLPLNYVGYTLHYFRRKKEHEDHDTSWLLHLVLDVLRLEYGKQSFTLDNYVVCFMASEDEVKVAEPLIGRITDSSYDTGGGFSIEQGGVQVASGTSSDRQADIFLAGRTFRDEHTDSVAILSAVAQKMKAMVEDPSLVPDFDDWNNPRKGLLQDQHVPLDEDEDDNKQREARKEARERLKKQREEDGKLIAGMKSKLKPEGEDEHDDTVHRHIKVYEDLRAAHEKQQQFRRVGSV